MRGSSNERASTMSPAVSIRCLAETYEKHHAMHELQVLGEALVDFDPTRVKVAHVIHSSFFKAFMATCVFLSIGIVIHETDRKASEQPLPEWMDTALLVLLGVYTVELGLRLYVSGHKFFWTTLNLVDLTLVAVELGTMAFERFIPTLPNVMVIRFFRLIRVARLSSVLMRFRPLYLIIQGFFGAMQAICFAALLILIVLSLWSILAVEFVHPVAQELAIVGQFADCERCAHAYSSVMQSNLTFLQTIIVGDSWSVYIMPIVDRDWRCAILFGGAFITVQVGMLNLILSVIVDSASQARQEDEQRMLYEKKRAFAKAKTRFDRLCSQLDTDQSGTLTSVELHEGLKTNPEFSQLLAAMDITEAELDVLFKMMDLDNSGDVSYEEFSEFLHRFKTDDLRTQIMFLKHYVFEITNKLDDELGSRLRSIELSAGRRINESTGAERRSKGSISIRPPFRNDVFELSDDSGSRCSSTNASSHSSSSDGGFPSSIAKPCAAGPQPNRFSQESGNVTQVSKGLDAAAVSSKTLHATLRHHGNDVQASAGWLKRASEEAGCVGTLKGNQKLAAGGNGVASNITSALKPAPGGIRGMLEPQAEVRTGVCKSVAGNLQDVFARAHHPVERDGFVDCTVKFKL